VKVSSFCLLFALTQSSIPATGHQGKAWWRNVTLVVLETIVYAFANSVDPDQRAL